MVESRDLTQSDLDDLQHYLDQMKKEGVTYGGSVCESYACYAEYVRIGGPDFALHSSFKKEIFG